MPKTRKQERSAEEEKNAEQLERTEDVTKDTPTSSEPNVVKEDDAAAKARERQARFKALQARAVSDSFIGLMTRPERRPSLQYCIADTTIEIRYRAQLEGNCGRNSTSLN